MNSSHNGANYGIIGNVKADAVAVGAGANAVVNETAASSRAEFESALNALREQLAQLQIPQSGRQVLDDDVARIAKMGGDKPRAEPAAGDVLKGMVEKLKMVGVLMQTAVGFQEPLKKLAEWFHVGKLF